MIQKIESRSEPAASIRVLIVAMVLTMCVAWLYRQQLLNGFTILAGDRYDGVISTTILEHWYNVFRGRSNWAEVNYFYPHVRSLANTDGYFIVGIIYAPFRQLGFDPFYSAELANMVVKSVGFIGMYWMCRRVFTMPLHWALLAAVLFTLNNGMTVHSSRSQLATVAFTPFMVILLWRGALAVRQSDFGKARHSGILAGLLFGAWCLTCFYAAWFFLYFFIVFGVIALITLGKPCLTLIREQITRHARSYLFVLAASLLALAPFLYAFLPKAKETGVRNYSESLAFTVLPENILQLGKENIFVGKAYNEILLGLKPDYLPSHEYYNTGFGILLFLLFIIAATRIARQERKHNKLIFSLLLATTITWVSTLNVGGYSLWYAVFHIIPGAKALRVVSAYYIFLALPVIVITVRYLAMRRLPTALTLALAALLIMEELNAPALGLVRQTEMKRIALTQMPPSACKAFYASGWSDQTALTGPAGIYAHNVSAMLIAQQLDIPTVNGIASFMAPDWDFANPNRQDYDARVRSYASKNDVQGLCRLDLNDKTWDVVDPATIRTIPLDFPVFEKSTWPGGVASFTGLSGPEPWGRWSLGKVIQFTFTEPLPPKFALHLTGHAFAHNGGKDFHVVLNKLMPDNVTSSGTGQKFSVPGDKDVERIMRFDNPMGSRHISIIVPHPVSPAELGASGDARAIGLALAKLRVEPL
jgi:hypothetical protein